MVLWEDVRRQIEEELDVELLDGRWGLADDGWME
jgi:hypothetical protein